MDSYIQVGYNSGLVILKEPSMSEPQVIFEKGPYKFSKVKVEGVPHILVQGGPVGSLPSPMMLTKAEAFQMCHDVLDAMRKFAKVGPDQSDRGGPV